ncbi:MAG: SPFH domain-containing protein [Phycisphaerae bacterium]
MNEGSPTRDRRAQFASLTGLLIQLVLFGVVLVVGLWQETQSDAVVAGARHLLGGVLIWGILLVVFIQRRRSRLEDLDTEQLKRAQAAGLTTNIFDVGDESLLLERRRLAWTYKFLLPTITVLVALYHIGGTFVAWSWPLSESLAADTWTRADKPLIAMVFMAASAFCCFVYGRYVIGMSRQPGWRLLRAGGSYLIGNALTSTVLVIALAVAGSRTLEQFAEPLAAYIIRVMLLLLGIEFVINLILEFYRPQRSDEEIRPAFDSRMLALFSEPGGIVRSIAETINYQFGFEVSGTWFYKLLQRSLFPLTVLTLAALILLSSIVIVDVDEKAYIERLGKVRQARDAPLGPGFNLKLPWPIDRVVRERVHRMRSLTVGTKHGESWKKREGVDHADEYEDAEHELHHAVLWTEEHKGIISEMLMVVANPESDALAGEQGHWNPGLDGGATATAPSGGAGVSLLMISAGIQYHITDLHDYVYRYQDPVSVLESIARQELSDYAAGHDAATLMGKGREEYGREMMRRLQERCDEMQVGIHVTSVGLHAHPPSKENVAAKFQEVISAEIRKAAAIEHAQGAHDRILTLAAGSVQRAGELDAAIQKMNRATADAERLGTDEAAKTAAQAEQLVEDLLLGNRAAGMAPASGKAATTISTAEAKRAQAVSEAESKLRTFQTDLVAYQAAPKLFKMRRYLGMLVETLPGLRKFVYTGDPSKLIIAYETTRRTYLDLTTEEEEH